ncbi:MAG TPA: fibrillarin-like rRNA/tRNA 2'-O-methyltransferase [Candidatus Lokiarchaeia archaeon]|nr:fibrillarin-like rRNA/tRNA 2'-O-methyltransferase [Candidatus Lokiarchaeia archaeon]
MMMSRNAFSVKPSSNFEGVYSISADGTESLGTLNQVPGVDVYGEKLFRVNDTEEYREWNPNRSKLCAYLRKGGKEYYLREGISVLYLGAANGTTVSHVSDIVGKNGFIYAIEFSARSLRELVQRCSERPDVIPMLADATKPAQYRSLIPEQVDVIYQDVAQPEQSKLLVDNIQTFLKPGGYFYIAIKSRSIDVAVEPEIIFQKERAILEKAGCIICDDRDISPFSEDHVMIAGKID